jgi:hypothetical protein
MGGFGKVLRRMTMVAFGLGFAFGTPNAAHAQAPPLQTARLPWQTPAAFTSAAPFENGWMRVVSETEQLIRTYADLNLYGGLPAITPATQSDTSASLWTSAVPTSSPPIAEQPTFYVGTVRATFKPVEVASSIVAESRNIQGVLIGLQLDVLD